MPRTRSLKWSELKIGIMAVTALVIAATLILALSGEGGFFWQRYSLKVKFPNAGGVQIGSPVRVGGVAVGSVTEMRFVGAEVEMDLELNEAMQDKVRTTSRATVGAVSLLGEGAVDITASTTGDPIPEYGYVTNGPVAGQLSDVTAQVSQLGAALTSIVTDIQAGKGTAGKFITDERLYADLQEMTEAARQVTVGLQQGKGTLGQLLNNPESARQLEASLQNLSAITSKINTGQGSLGQLMNDPTLARNLTATTASVENLTSKLNKGQGTMGKLLNDEALYQRLNAVTTNLERLTSNLNDGQGTMGQLLKDKQLYENLNKTLGEMQGLLAAIKQDPKKYLNLRMSIF
jgi:phospholipid/cholesterol/gamma-HCH transport system substrate-binding protein